MQTKVQEWLETGKVDIFLGYKKVAGHPLPYAFSRKNVVEVKEMNNPLLRSTSPHLDLLHLPTESCSS